MKHLRRRVQKKDTFKYIFGRFIRDQRVLCIDHNNNNLGLIDTRDALQKAKEAGLELVLVSRGKDGKPSTCRILDFGKYKYEQEKKEKAVKKKQRENAIRIKEIKIRPSTDDNDLLTKARQLQDFVADGNRLKVTVVFKGREMCHRNIGLETLNKFAQMISGQFDSDPSISGRTMTVMLVKEEKAEAV